MPAVPIPAQLRNPRRVTVAISEQPLEQPSVELNRPAEGLPDRPWVPLSRLALQSLGVAVDVDAVTPQERGEGDAGRLRHPDRQTGRVRDRRQQRDPGDGALLDQLVAG